MSWLAGCVCAPCDDGSGGVEVASVQATTGGDEYYIPPEDSYRTEVAKPGKTVDVPAQPDANPALGEDVASPPESRQNSRALLSRPMAREFEVQVIRGSGSLGLDIVAAKDRKAVIIGRVKPGAVQALNSDTVAAGARDDMIKRGDRIVEVDGCGQGDAGEITRALKSATEIVSLKFVRLLEFKVGNLGKASGLRFAEGPSGGLMITGLELAANKSLQPDVELREGDYVMKVNGKSGTPAELQAEIDSSDVLNLRVRRDCPDEP